MVANRGLIYRFAFEFTDTYRKEMSGLHDYLAIEKYLDKVNLLNRFIDFSKKRGVEPEKTQIEESKELIETQLRAAIARNLIDNEGYYPIIKRIDTTLLYAMEILKKEENNR